MWKTKKNTSQLRFLKFFSLLILTMMPIVATAQYSLVGMANESSVGTYTLTNDLGWQNGSVWNTNKIDLQQSFEVYFELYLGSHDDGADGITFTLQQQGTNAGGAGGGIGATGIKPSLIIEFDTYQNSDYADPSYDHIAIEKNGVADHTSSNLLAGPVQASSTTLDIEDSKWHKGLVKWNANTQSIDIYFDCVLRLHYSNDIVSTIFGQNPLVYYGFTASTGGSTNEQKVGGFQFQHKANIDSSICAGDSLCIDLSGQLSYNWQPNYAISSTTSAKPILFPAKDTTYTVTITNHCFQSYDETVNIKVLPKPRFNLGSDTSICEGQNLLLSTSLPGAKLLWFTQESTPSIHVDSTATVWLEAFYDAQCKVRDSLLVQRIPLPVSTHFPDTTICFLDQALLTLDAGNQALHHLWQNGDSTQKLNVYNEGMYTVTLSNNASCAITDSIFVSNDCLYTLFAPNVFTPFNNDGINDVFLFKGIKVFDFHISIFNRWGELLFESSNMDEGWNGIYKGNPVQIDVYVWKLDYRDSKKRQRTGHLSIIN